METSDAIHDPCTVQMAMFWECSQKHDAVRLFRLLIHSYICLWVCPLVWLVVRFSSFASQYGHFLQLFGYPSHVVNFPHTLTMLSKDGIFLILPRRHQSTNPYKLSPQRHANRLAESGPFGLWEFWPQILIWAHHEHKCFNESCIFFPFFFVRILRKFSW